jgi:hypothetical protein
MEMWQWIMLFSAVSLNTIVNICRLWVEIDKKEKDEWDINLGNDL